MEDPTQPAPSREALIDYITGMLESMPEEQIRLAYFFVLHLP